MEADAATLSAIHAKLDALVHAAEAGQQRFFTVASAARYADLSSKSIRRLVASGSLQALRPCRGRILVDRTQLDSLILGATGRPRKGRGLV